MAAECKQSYKSEDVLRLFFANESSSSESPDSDEDFQQYIGMIAQSSSEDGDSSAEVRGIADKITTASGTSTSVPDILQPQPASPEL